MVGFFTETAGRSGIDPNRRRPRGGRRAVRGIASSGPDRDSFRGAVERGEIAVMRHKTHAHRLDSGGDLYRIRQPQSGAPAYASGAVRNFRSQVGDAPSGR